MRLAMLATIAVAVGLGCAARAQDPPAEAPAIWSVAGREVLRVRVAVGSLTPSQRVELFDSRLTEILSNATKAIVPGDLVLRSERGTISIVVTGELLVTITKGDADANRTTPERLAQIWLANLRKTVPLLSPRVNPGGA